MVRSGAFLAVVLMVVGVGFPAWGQAEFSRYELNVKLDPETRTLSGTLQLDYVNDTQQSLEAVTFFLIANLLQQQNPYIDLALQDGAYPEGFDPGWTRVFSVTDGSGGTLNHRFEAIDPYFQTFSLEDVVMVVDLPQPLAPDARTTLLLAFETKFPHAANIDSVYYKDVYTWRWGWHPIAVSPNFLAEHQLALPTARYQATLTLPEAFVLASGADRQKQLSVEDGWQVVSIENEVPTRSIALIASPLFQSFTLNHSVVPIQAYYLPGHESAMRLTASYAATQLDYFSSRFGEYGFQRLVMVENAGPGGYGMAADAMVAFGTDIFHTKDLLVPGLLDRALEWTVAHEVGHLWWGIGVGTDFNSENWLSEGFAQYLSLTYYEDTHGAFGPNVLDHLGDGLIENMIKDEFGYFNLRQHNNEIAYISTLMNRFDEPIVASIEDTQYSNATQFRTYMKGYLVTRALEGLLGREAMFETLKTMYERHGHQIASVEILQQTAEEISGQDLDSFFQSWLYRADFADVAVKAFASGETDTEAYETDVTVTRNGNAVYPVTVRVTGEDGEQAEQIWLSDSHEATLTFQTQTEVVAVVVDPLEMLPDADRFNNHLPRKVVVKRGEAEFPLDAYFIRWSNTSISGQQGLDHFWSINIVPSVAFPVAEAQQADHEDNDHEHTDSGPGHDEHNDDRQDAPGETALEDAAVTLNAVALFNAFIDRGLSVSGLLTATGYDPLDEHSSPTLAGEVGVNWSLFEHPHTGSPAKFWYPANFVRAGLGVVGTLAEPIPYVGLDYVRQDTLTLGWRNSISLRAGIEGEQPFVLGNVTSSKHLRIMHGTYLNATVKLGGAPQPLPEPMALSLDELQAFAELPQGDLKAFGRLALWFPSMRELNFSLANLALLKHVTLIGFVQGGWTWRAGRPLGFEHLISEVGVQLNVDIDITLGVTASFYVGYAHPLTGGQDGEFGLVYFGI